MKDSAGIMAKGQRDIGLWLIGGCGGVGTTVAMGIEAVRRKLVPPTGLIGDMPPFDALGLAPLSQWVVGGHEIRKTTFESSANQLYQESDLFSPDLIKACKPWLAKCTRNLRDGTTVNCGSAIEKMADRPGVKRKQPAAAIVEQLTDDIRSFAKRNKLDRVVVVNVASTEPPMRKTSVPKQWSSLKYAMSRRTGLPLPASSLYAIAAIEAGASYINFTPSTGIDLPAIREHADEMGAVYMGADGKTGETLMKSVLAPMFAARNLEVLSWVGHNIFGNRDGMVLDEPANKATKTKSKDQLVAKMLGYKPKTLVSIEYIESMGDWKTAWDHIHFSGFLGTKMALQFTWQGCDSILAAPLVIELARFAELAARRGESGPLKHLSCFFKSPMAVREQGFARQYEELLVYARST
jgi:myo-inositol-1-phosphate synthase